MHNGPYLAAFDEMKGTFANRKPRQQKEEAAAEKKPNVRISGVDGLMHFNIREDDPEKQGLFAVCLLMNGSYISQLTKLLEESETPITVKLFICDFLLKEGFMETSEIVGKTLVEISHIGRKEWHANKKTNTSTSYEDQ
jgi:hypothetical protein